MKFALAHSRQLSCLAVLAWLATACGKSGTPEQAVRATLAAAETAAEARDVGDALALVADDYSDDNGFDKARLRDFVRGYFVMNPHLEVVMKVETIEFPATNLARARVSVAALGRAGSGPLGLSADGERFDVELVQLGSEWRLRRAQRARD